MNKDLFKNKLFIIFIFIINMSISDAFFIKLYIPPSILSLLRLGFNLIFILVLTFYFLTKRILVHKYMKVILFMILLGISIIWTANKFETIKLFINFVGIISSYIIIFSKLEKEDSIKIIYLFSKIIIILNALCILLLGNVAYMEQHGKFEILRGIHLSRSALTVYLNFTIFGVSYYILKFKENRKEILKAKIYLAISILLVVLSKSSTGILTIALFIPLFIVLKYKKLSKILLRIFIVLGVLLPVLTFESGILNKIFGKLFGKSLTFTGRKYIWDYALDKLTNNSIIGNGFNSTMFILEKKVIPIYNRVAAHTHNGFLEVFLQNGIIGLLLIILILISVFKLTFYFDKKEANFIRAYFIVVIIFNYMEPYLINNVSFTILWLPLIYVISIAIKIIKEKVNG